MKIQRRYAVQSTASKLRDLIFEQEPDSFIGSLPDLARQLDVGIATVQQAARILEHEGLLQVRRGTGGGYYGTRPDEAALERSIKAYIRVHPSASQEAMDMMSMLDSKLVSIAAQCEDSEQLDALIALQADIDLCDTEEQRIAFEESFQKILFKMVDRPLIELLTRLTMTLYKSKPIPPILPGDAGVSAWKTARHRLLNAIILHDNELAEFEAARYRKRLTEGLR